MATPCAHHPFCSTGSGMSFRACLAMSPWFISRAPAASKAATQSSQGRFVALVIADVLVGLTMSLFFNDLWGCARDELKRFAHYPGCGSQPQNDAGCFDPPVDAFTGSKHRLQEKYADAVDATGENHRWPHGTGAKPRCEEEGCPGRNRY